MKPCPFCGATRLIELTDRFDAGHLAWILCERCSGHGPTCYSERGEDAAMADARKEWDRRVRP